jgi:hypothetical protein
MTIVGSAPGVVSNVDPVLVPLHKSLFVDHRSPWKESHRTVGRAQVLSNMKRANDKLVNFHASYPRAPDHPGDQWQLRQPLARPGPMILTLERRRLSAAPVREAIDSLARELGRGMVLHRIDDAKDDGILGQRGLTSDSAIFGIMPGGKST